jgi:hypothetical protein
MNEHSTGWRRGIDHLLVEIEIDDQDFERAQHVDQIRLRAACAIYRRTMLTLKRPRVGPSASDPCQVASLGL